MSLFPAYNSGNDQDLPKIVENNEETPAWLKNTSFKKFEQLVRSESSSRSSSSSFRSPSPERSRRDKEKRSRSRGKRSRSRSHKKIRKRSISKKRSQSKSRRKSRSRSTKRSHKRSRSGSQKRSRSRKKKSRSRSRKKSPLRSCKRSRSRSSKVSKAKKRSRSPNKKSVSKRYRKSGQSRRSRSHQKKRRQSDKGSASKHGLKKKEKNVEEKQELLDRDIHPEQIIASSKEFAKKVFVEEVGISMENAFRVDKKGDRTNLAGQGLYAKDVALYRSKIRNPMGQPRRPTLEAKQNSRFHQKTFIKHFLKSRNVVQLNKDKVGRNKKDVEADLRNLILRLDWEGSQGGEKEEKYDKYNLEAGDSLKDIYDSTTQDYLKGVGGLSLQNTADSSQENYESVEIKQKRLEFNSRLRQNPTDVDLWIEFIDFQDEALKETIFELDDDLGNKTSKRKRGEVLRAKALTERKLAICRSAIEKNSRSIKLAVKRLELSQDLLDSKTLDQQWKELIFVYPENISLWKRYLLFVQTFYIRFSVSETVKAYKGCILKLRQQQQLYIDQHDDQQLFEVEHGILDILGQLAVLLRQCGQGEKAVALFQALLEINLCQPDFSGPGEYDFDDKVGLFEPIWEEGLPRLGEPGALGWGHYLANPQGHQQPGEEGAEDNNDWEDEILASHGDKEKAEIWLEIEAERERRQWAPWRKKGEEPEDPERRVSFDFVCGFLVEFARKETRFRLLYTFLTLLGLQLPDREFSNLVNSAAAEHYFNHDKIQNQNFRNCELQLLQNILPTFRKQEGFAIFIHTILAQTYNRFKEPFRTHILAIWLEFETDIIRLNKGPGAKELRKDLRRLVKSLLKEDRNNLELIVKFAELEYELDGYKAAQPILETAILAANSNILKQSTEEGFLAATLLYRAAVELELREIVRIQQEHAAAAGASTTLADQNNDDLHRNRLQWLLVHIGCGKKYSSYASDKNQTILALIEGAQRSFREWIAEDIQNISVSKIFQMAPFIRHSIADVIFFYAWLTKFSSGTSDAVKMVTHFRDEIRNYDREARFDQLKLTQAFLFESLDKICFDMLYFDSLFDAIEKQNLRNFYKYCLSTHYTSRYFQGKLLLVQDTTSIVSPIWQEILHSIHDKKKTNLALIEESCNISLQKFVSVLDHSNPEEITALGQGFLNKLSNLVERCVTRPFLKNSPLIWRLLLWTSSLQNMRNNETVGCENLKVMLYRAIQDVPWCKALYLDTALYLNRIGQLYPNKRKTVAKGDSEDEADQEQKYEEIPGTLEHINELMVEKEVRVRLPLPELDVLLEA